MTIQQMYNLQDFFDWLIDRMKDDGIYDVDLDLEHLQLIASDRCQLAVIIDDLTYSPRLKAGDSTVQTMVAD